MQENDSYLTQVSAGMPIEAQHRFAVFADHHARTFMEFHIKLAGPIAEFGAIEDAIRKFDPAAQIDIDQPGRNLRVAASLEASDLLALLNDAGHPVSPLQVVQLPSVCCGGCGG